MKVSICVNQPGFLPDSDIYPFTIEGNKDDIRDAILTEYGVNSPDHVISNYDWDQLNKHLDVTLDEMDKGVIAGWSDNLPDGKYIIDVNLYETSGVGNPD